jgi:anti-anti-sigma factor
MKYSLDKREHFVIIKVEESKILGVQAPELKSQLTILNVEGFKNMILDLEEVSYVDSSGLSAILTGDRICKDADGTFIIANASSNVSKLVSISRLDSVLNLVPSVNESIEMLMQKEINSEA